MKWESVEQSDKYEGKVAYVRDIHNNYFYTGIIFDKKFYRVSFNGLEVEDSRQYEINLFPEEDVEISMSLQPKEGEHQLEENVLKVLKEQGIEEVKKKIKNKDKTLYVTLENALILKRERIENVPIKNIFMHDDYYKELI